MARVRVGDGPLLEDAPEPPRDLWPGDMLVHGELVYSVIYVWAWAPRGAPVEHHVTVSPVPHDGPLGAQGWHRRGDGCAT